MPLTQQARKSDVKICCGAGEIDARNGRQVKFSRTGMKHAAVPTRAEALELASISRLKNNLVMTPEYFLKFN
jgi:hypothetical protein